MRHHIQILRRIKGDALRPSEPTHKGLDLAIRRNTINLIRPRQGRKTDVQPPVIRKRQVISCHRGNEARKDPEGAILGDLQDRPASITNIESALGIKGETSGNPKLGGKGDSRTLLVHAVDSAFMATTNIQSAIRSKGKARRIRNGRRQGHDLAFWRYAVERDRHVLVFRPADRRIDVALCVHSGARHRMQIVGKPRRNRKRHRIALPLTLDNMDITDCQYPLRRHQAAKWASPA